MTPKPLITAYPRCNSRGVLSSHFDGEASLLRVTLNDLYVTLTQEERVYWERTAMFFPCDDFGMLPDAVEQFLSGLLNHKRSNMRMRATTVSQKPREPRRARAAAGSANGSAKLVAGNAKYDADQATLAGMEDVKCQAVETCIKKIVAAEARQAQAKTDHDNEVARLPGLFKKHALEKYAAHGRSVSIQPGVDKVLIKKVKDK